MLGPFNDITLCHIISDNIMSRHEGGLGCASLLCRIQCKGFAEGSSFCLVLWVLSMIVQFWLQCKVIPPLAAAKIWAWCDSSLTLSRSRQHCWSLRGQCAAGGDEAPGLKGSDWWRVPSFRAVHQWKATRCLCIPLHLSNLITTVLDLKKKKINCTNMMLSCQPLLWQPLWTDRRKI